MIRAVSGAILSLTLFACASGSGETRELPQPAAATPARRATEQPFDPNVVIGDALSSRECAQRALDQRLISPQRGWETLRACVVRQIFPRDRFSSWSLLLPDWRADLRSRKEVPALLARLIAARGGDVEGDLQILRQNDLAYETLGEATHEGAAAKGKNLILRGQLIDDAGAPNGALLFAKTTVRAVHEDPQCWSYFNRPKPMNQVVFTQENAWARTAGPDLVMVKRKDCVALVRVDGVRFKDSRLELSILTVYTPAAELSD